MKCWPNMSMKPPSEPRTLNTAMKIAPAMMRVNKVSARRPLRRKVLRMERISGRERKVNQMPS